MADKNKSFRHESLQDRNSIQDMLKALSKAIAKGKLSFSDEQGEIVMYPQDLLNVKLVASENDAHKRIDLRISWYSEDEPVKKKTLTVE